MKLITSTCWCHDWDNVGVDVDAIPGSIFGGIHWLTDKDKAISLWTKLKAVKSQTQFTCFLDPYYWAVHLNGKHILNIIK